MRPRRSNKLKLAVLIVVALLVGVGIGIASFLAVRGPALVAAPRLTGLTYGEASNQATASGLDVKIDPKQHFSSTSQLNKKKVTEQTPAAGMALRKGATISVALEPDKTVKQQPRASSHVVCLDPGHSPGPFPSVIDPASGLDVADAEGADGEVQTNWNIAVQAKALLEQEGYTVKLTRPSVSSQANLRQRVDIANTCDIAVRIHFDPSVHAVLFPGTGQTKSHGGRTMTVSEDLSAKSRVLAYALFPYLQPLGVTRVDNDMGGSSNNTGGAYVGSVLSTVPIVVVENDPAVVRDNPSGQAQDASAIVKGIDAYFKGLQAP